MFCAAAAAFGFLGALSLVTGVILVIGDQWLPSDGYAIGALLVAIVAGVITWLFVRRGLTTLSGVEPKPIAGEAARAD
jgi:hypothetical protein